MRITRVSPRTGSSRVSTCRLPPVPWATMTTAAWGVLRRPTLVGSEAGLLNAAHSACNGISTPLLVPAAAPIPEPSTMLLLGTG